MSEETAAPTTPAGTTASTRRTLAASSRRRGATKPANTGDAALQPERSDAFQAASRVWPD